MTTLAEIKADVAPFGPDEKAWLIAEAEKVELRERQMGMAARYIARYYEADRNDYAKKSDVDDARQMVFAIGADLKRILEESVEAEVKT